MSANKKRSGAELARQRDLASHERVIENARQSFVDWGRALGKIRIEKLYEVDGYADFDEYVIERWEMRPQHAYRLITAARVALILSPMGYKITSERAARELAPIAEDAEMLRAVYEEADRRAAGGRVTAALIAASREALAPQIIDGDWTDDDEPELTGVVEAMREAIEEIEHNQASGPAATSPAGGSGDNQPATAAPVEAEDGGPSSAADAEASANQTGEDSAPVESPVDEPERADDAGVSSPPAPAPKPAETAEQLAERERLEFCTDRTNEFSRALVDLTMRLGDDPIRWYENVYLHGVYFARDLPRVSDCFEPDSLDRLADMLRNLATYLRETGQTL